jgi:hypothetical protein
VTEAGSTLEVMFSTPGLTYKTAGNLAIYPLNSQDDVERFAKQVKLNLNYTFCLVPNDKYTGRKA